MRSLPLPAPRWPHLDPSRHQRRADRCWSRAELLRDCRERRTLDIPERGALYLLPCQSSALVAERNAPALADLADRGAVDVEALSDLLDRDTSLVQLNNFELLLDRQVQLRLAPSPPRNGLWGRIWRFRGLCWRLARLGRAARPVGQQRPPFFVMVAAEAHHEKAPGHPGASAFPAARCGENARIHHS